MSYNIFDKILTQKDYNFIKKYLLYKIFKINYFTKNYKIYGIGFLIENKKSLKFFLIEKPIIKYKKYNGDKNIRILILNKKSKFTLFPMTLGYNYHIDKHFDRFKYLK